MLRPIAVTTHKHSVAIFYHETNQTYDGIDHVLRYGKSTDGSNFDLLGSSKITIETKKGTPEKIETCDDFKISNIGDLYILSYIRNKIILVEAYSKNVKNFIIASEVKNKNVKSIALWGKKFVSYHGNHSISTSVSNTTDKWIDTGSIVLSPRKGFFDYGALKIIGVHNLSTGILVMYSSNVKNIVVGAALFSNIDPHKIIWRSEQPLWEKDLPKEEQWKIAGTVFFNSEIILYVGNNKNDVLTIKLPQVVRGMRELSEHASPLIRVMHNPVLEPHAHNDWENQAVFNPGAIYDNGEVHLLYRAVGNDGLSTIGYAKSPDGLYFKRAHHKPIYVLNTGSNGYDISFYPSGGGSGGSEDPRTVILDNRVYVTYVYFGGWDSMRMAMTSISLEDFRDKKWNWAKPIFLSPQGEMHKNWVIFPEKIKGKFAILHSVSPTIKIDYVSDLSKSKIKSSAPSGGRKNFWDNKVRGAGPPPIKTNRGWLLLYHATDAYDPQRYKLGAMLLDLQDPTKVLARSSRPILCPDMHYENEGKPGVVYASGAIVKDGTLFVYYGGGDRVICTATAELHTLIDDLITGHEIHLEVKANLNK